MPSTSAMKHTRILAKSVKDEACHPLGLKTLGWVLQVIGRPMDPQRFCLLGGLQIRDSKHPEEGGPSSTERQTHFPNSSFSIYLSVFLLHGQLLQTSLTPFHEASKQGSRLTSEWLTPPYLKPRIQKQQKWGTLVTMNLQ